MLVENLKDIANNKIRLVIVLLGLHATFATFAVLQSITPAR